MGLNFMKCTLICFKAGFCRFSVGVVMSVLRGRIDGWDDLEGGDRTMFFVRRYTKYTKKATELELKFKNSFCEPNL